MSTSHRAVSTYCCDSDHGRRELTVTPSSCKPWLVRIPSSLLAYLQLLTCANDAMHECGNFASLNKCWTMICCWATEKDYKVMLNNNIIFVGGLLVCCYNGRSSVCGPIVNFTTIENRGGTIPWLNTYILIAGKRKPGYFFKFIIVVIILYHRRTAYYIVKSVTFPTPIPGNQVRVLAMKGRAHTSTFREVSREWLGFLLLVFCRCVHFMDGQVKLARAGAILGVVGVVGE